MSFLSEVITPIGPESLLRAITVVVSLSTSLSAVPGNAGALPLASPVALGAGRALCVTAGAELGLAEAEAEAEEGVASPQASSSRGQTKDANRADTFIGRASLCDRERAVAGSALGSAALDPSQARAGFDRS